MSFQGKKSIPRITVSLLRPTPSAHCPALPGLLARGGPSPPGPARRWADPCPGCDPSRAATAAAAATGAEASRSRAPRPGPCCVPDLPCAGGRGAGPPSEAQTQLRPREGPAGGRRGGGFGCDSASELAGGRGLLLAPPAAPGARRCRPAHLALGQPPPRPSAAPELWSETKRLGPTRPRASQGSGVRRHWRMRAH